MPPIPTRQVTVALLLSPLAQAWDFVGRAKGLVGSCSRCEALPGRGWRRLILVRFVFSQAYQVEAGIATPARHWAEVCAVRIFPDRECSLAAFPGCSFAPVAVPLMRFYIRPAFPCSSRHFGRKCTFDRPAVPGNSLQFPAVRPEIGSSAGNSFFVF